MTIVTAHISMSIDGFMAGPDQDLERPVGRDGDDLFNWANHPDGREPADQASRDELLRPLGAFVMGRNMFGPIRDDWSDDWRGWWGDDPPYHSPVFVLTHYPRESVEMAGGTTFHFVTEGFDAAMERARDVAGDDDIRICGGASTLRQAFDAGVINELHVAVSPMLFGVGERLFEGRGREDFEQLAVDHSSRATYIHYRVA